jgi:hypothetical protein
MDETVLDETVGLVDSADDDDDAEVNVEEADDETDDNVDV